MANIKPFICIRPDAKYAARTAALPYDVYNREEAKAEAALDPVSFLNIDRPETQFPDTQDIYAPENYRKAAEMLQEQLALGIYQKDTKESYYIYELTMDGRVQNGIVGCASLDDYIDGIIKKHENTREEKELDRIRHVDVMSAQTGPIFLACRKNEELKKVINEAKQDEPLYDFISKDGIRHRVFQIGKTDAESGRVSAIQRAFKEMEAIYIADGHHRAASAVKVGLKRRDAHPGYTGTEEFNYFLSVTFLEDELAILPYNRLIKDWNGHTKEELLTEAAKYFAVSKQSAPVSPEKKGVFGMYLDGEWYRLEAKEELLNIKDPVAGLDVSLLQDYLLKPVFGIEDPRTDKRIDFVGGIRGLGELERRAKTDMAAAFSMYPTSIQELFEVADAGLLMPPKSTWFEPKLRSGLFIHEIEK
ncbi:MAG: DUF1015 domain-containing protein [Lachnospiraceae bacterium]|nr:DUF1015 domain-containing protein [Lachnospiraceae bacterium]